LSINQSTEVDIGRQAATDLERQYGVVNDPAAQARVTRIGERIAGLTPRADLPWTFKILNDASVNALALPGGFIYVTRGLMDLNLPDTELAGILGHEIAHVTERHSVKAIQRNMQYSLLSELILGRSSEGLQTAASLALQFAVELPHSRGDEYDADGVGTRLAYNAGYQANGLLLFLTRLQQISGPSRTPAWLSTHPLTTERIEREQQLVASLQGQPRPVPVTYTGDEPTGKPDDET
jgi:predicted Zn-dependent protease